MLARICLNGVFVCVFVFVCVVLCGFIEKACGTHTERDMGKREFRDW